MSFPQIDFAEFPVANQLQPRSKKDLIQHYLVQQSNISRLLTVYLNGSSTAFSFELTVFSIEAKSKFGTIT